MSKKNEAMALAMHNKADEIGTAARIAFDEREVLVGQDPDGWAITVFREGRPNLHYRVLEVAGEHGHNKYEFFPWTPPGMGLRPKTPYANLLVGFQEALEKYGSAERDLIATMETSPSAEEHEKARMAVHDAKVLTFQKYNDVLTKYQNLQEGRITRRGRPRAKRCCFCGNLEDATKAHRVTMEGARKWTCDGCWDERLRD